MVRVFVLLFSFSVFSCSLKVENENNSMKTEMQKFDLKSHIWNHRDARTSSSQAG